MYVGQLSGLKVLQNRKGQLLVNHAQTKPPSRESCTKQKRRNIQSKVLYSPRTSVFDFRFRARYEP